MFHQKPLRRLIGVLVLGATIQVTGADHAMGGVISPTPTLPLLQSYGTASGLGCLPLLGICFTSDSLTLTSLVSSTFNVPGEDFVTDAVWSGQITTTGGSPLGPFSLTGTMEQQVNGRTFSTEPGTWTTDIVALALSGPLLGGTLTLGLDATHASTGTTSIVPSGDEFDISSFFDLYLALDTDGRPPLHSDIGPVRFDVIPGSASESVPEPASLLLLATALLGLAATKRSGASAT